MCALTPEGSLDLTADPVELARALCDIPSVSGDEARIADTIEDALEPFTHLQVTRVGNTLIARTELGRARRVAIAGHLDTVPINDNVPSRMITIDEAEGASRSPAMPAGEYLWGRGSVDMKSGVAVQLHLAATLVDPLVDITWMWYEHEEIDAERNGLTVLARERPDLFDADFAILGEPTSGEIEGGCNGSIRAEIIARGRRAHSARSWTGENAVHRLAPALDTLAAFEPATVRVDGLDYREGLNAVGIRGGVAGNVIPDEAAIHVNYRFAPDATVEQAIDRIRSWFPGYEIEVLDASAPARPGLDAPIAQEFVAAVGSDPRPKYGWTDVARFSQMGVPAVNYGPGDPHKAHADDEACLVEDIVRVERGLRSWLSGARE